MKKKVNLMLDSGAFSAWRQQKPIDIKEYAKYLEKNYDIVDTAINLDVMPGQAGKPRTQAEVKYAAEQSFKNFIYLRKCGFETIPVFHQGEDFYWLEKMLGVGCTYIGVSPVNGPLFKLRKNWMDLVFAYLCGDKGYPEIKTHGFGMTTNSLIARYPWYSVDSISWVLWGAYGWIIVPNELGGVSKYSIPSIMIHMSSRGSKYPSVDYGGAKVYKLLGTLEKEHIDEYCMSRGFSIKELQNNTDARTSLNFRYYKDLASVHKIQPYLKHVKNIFTSEIVSSHGTTTPKNKDLKFIFGVGTTASHNEILQRYAEKERLISYFELQKKPSDILSNYVKVGRFPAKRVKLKKPTRSTRRVRLKGA